MNEQAALRGMTWLLALAASGCEHSSLPAAMDGPAMAARDAAMAQLPDPDLASALPGCSDGMRDNDESDIDCGGSCPDRCQAGNRCGMDSDCAETLCIESTCRAKPTCADGRQDGTETDIDCGGNGCPRCVVEKKCTSRLDCLSGICSAGACAPCKLDFAAHADFGTGIAPFSLAVGDLDGDGRLDLAATNVGLDLKGTTVSVLINRGAGAFASVSYQVGTRPSAVVIADLDGNGKNDLAVTNASDASVSVLLNQGGGVLGGQRDYVTGFTPYSLAVVDLGGTGRLDLVTAGLTVNELSVLVNQQGQGRFLLGAALPTDMRPRAVTVGDVNGDGLPDLVSANQANTVSVILYQGAGMFAARKDSPASMFQSIAMGDLDGDGRPDVIVDNASAKAIGVLLNKGNGAFGAQSDRPISGTPLAVAIADLDGDGKRDLVAGAADHTVSVLLNRGGSTFAAAVDFVTGSGPVAIRVADVDGDGLLDVITANQTDNTVSVLANRCR